MSNLAHQLPRFTRSPRDVLVELGEDANRRNFTWSADLSKAEREEMYVLAATAFPDDCRDFIGEYLANPVTFTKLLKAYHFRDANEIGQLIIAAMDQHGEDAADKAIAGRL